MAWNLFSRRKRHDNDHWNIKTMFGPNLNFAVTESYKLLRTNLMFSFPDEGRGNAIGITSAVQSEGKSSTACNTAYALAEAGCKVLLLEADLRKPTVATKLGLAKSPGLTNLLVSREDYRDVIQKCSLAPGLDVIASGDLPPNPSELLGSNRMAELVEQLKQVYEYIVIDLPPVTVVSDTAAMSKVLDGVVMVVRAGMSDQHLLAEAMRQLEMVDLRVLGFAFRDMDSSGKKYGRRYSRKYYKYYAAEYAKNKQR